MFLLIIVFNKLQQYLCAAYPKGYVLHDCKWNGMFSMVCHVYLFQFKLNVMFIEWNMFSEFLQVLSFPKLF